MARLMRSASDRLFNAIGLLERVSPSAAGRVALVVRDLEAAVHRARARRQIAREVAEGTARPLSALPDAFERRSDTVFVLGSGASVARLTDAGWARIGATDAIGFNFWLVSPVIPQLYFIEGVRPIQRYRTFLALLEQRAEAMRGVPLVVDMAYWSWCGNRLSDLPATVQQNVFLHAPLRLPARTEAEFRHRLGVWAHRRPGMSDRLSAIVHHRASLCALCLVAATLGYRRIVLVGVDLNDTRYFWEVDDSYAGPFPPRLETGRVHRTLVDPAARHSCLLPIDRVLHCLREETLADLGVELTVANPQSRLAQLLPVEPGLCAPG